MSMKRLVDYPRLYDSTKLAALPTDELRAEYVWLLGIAGPNGSFEWCERNLWAAAYASVRERSLEDLSRYLQAFLDAGLLLKWEQGGKTWGYFAGSEKPGRLPRPSWRKRFAQSGSMAPSPPENLLLNRQHGAKPVSEAPERRESLTPEACIAHDTCVPLSLSESLSESESLSGTRSTPELTSTEGAFLLSGAHAVRDGDAMAAPRCHRGKEQEVKTSRERDSRIHGVSLAQVSRASQWRQVCQKREGVFCRGLWDQPQVWAEPSPAKNIPLAIPQRIAAAEVRRQMMEN